MVAKLVAEQKANEKKIYIFRYNTKLLCSFLTYDWSHALMSTSIGAALLIIVAITVFRARFGTICMYVVPDRTHFWLCYLKKKQEHPFRQGALENANVAFIRRNVIFVLLRVLLFNEIVHTHS